MLAAAAEALWDEAEGSGRTQSGEDDDDDDDDDRHHANDGGAAGEGEGYVRGDPPPSFARREEVCGVVRGAMRRQRLNHDLPPRLALREASAAAADDVAALRRALGRAPPPPQPAGDGDPGGAGSSGLEDCGQQQQQQQQQQQEQQDFVVSSSSPVRVLPLTRDPSSTYSPPSSSLVEGGKEKNPAEAAAAHAMGALGLLLRERREQHVGRFLETLRLREEAAAAQARAADLERDFDRRQQWGQGPNDGSQEDGDGGGAFRPEHILRRRRSGRSGRLRQLRLELSREEAALAAAEGAAAALAAEVERGTAARAAADAGLVGGVAVAMEVAERRAAAVEGALGATAALLRDDLANEFRCTRSSLSMDLQVSHSVGRSVGQLLAYLLSRALG